jgi:hypothetical protein
MGERRKSELDAYIERYEVLEVLKDDARVRVEKVMRTFGTDVPNVGPFIRKSFRDCDYGSSFEAIFEGQVEGVRLMHQPFVYECERSGSTLTVVMGYVEGEDLTHHVQSETAGTALIERVIGQLSDALIELHERQGRPLVHGAIRPSNVLLAGDGVEVLGLCASSHSKDVFDEGRRSSDESVYLAPEVVRYGYAEMGSDVYALGMVAAFCCTGEHPSIELIERGFDDWRIPPRVASVLRVATSIDPTKRYRCVRDLKRDLLVALAPEEEVDQTTETDGDPVHGMRGVIARRGRMPVGGYFELNDVTVDNKWSLALRNVSSMGPVFVCGCIWDVLVLQVFIIWHLFLMVAIPESLATSNFWLGTLFQYLMEYFLPSALISYGLMYKEPFRAYLGPLQNVGWLTQFLISVILAALSLLFVLVMFYFGYRY